MPWGKACVVLVGLTAVFADTVLAQPARRSFHAMGTQIVIEAFGPDKASIEKALDRARAMFERRHRAWYPWRPDSALARINRRLAAGRSAAAGPALIALLKRARELEALSGGRFNAAVGGLVELWGFDQLPPYSSPRPSPGAILAWTARSPSLANLRFSDRRVSSANTAVQLDLGGIAKGATVDAALAELREAGATGILINAGGDLRVDGHKGNDPWRVGIRDPRGGILASLTPVSGQAVFSSGDYERYRETASGDRRGHVLDPRTGQPAQGATHTTVIASDGTLADAAATALMVAGPDEWVQTAHGLGIEAALVMARDGSIHISRAMKERLELRTPHDRDVVVREISP